MKKVMVLGSSGATEEKLGTLPTLIYIGFFVYCKNLGIAPW